MRIPKLLLVLVVSLVGEVVSLQAQKPDSDLQAKAREQLRQKMNELGGQSAAPAPTNAAPSAPAKVVPPAAPVVAAPVVPAKPPAPPAVRAAPAAVTPPPAAPAVVVPAVDTNAQARAEAALRQKMAELDAQKAAPAAAPVVPVPPPAKPVVVAPPAKPTPPPAQPVVVAAPAKPAPAAVAPAAPAMQTPPPAAPVYATPTVNPEAQAKAEAALRQKMAELNAQQPAAAAPARPAIPAAPRKTGPGSPIIIPAAATPNFPPPAPMVPGSKEQRLYDLLQRYKADQLTPLEYHTQRAKILAEP